MFKWTAIAFAAISLQACSKSEQGPQVFLPTFMSADGKNLTALKLEKCGNGSQIDIRDNILTPENFRNVFQCANYDSTLTPLEPLFNSPDFPELLKSLNLVMKSGSTGEIKDTLKDWLQEDGRGTSRADRLLPFLSSLIKNPSFQDFLPVFDGILQAGRDIWQDLLPGLADVVYTDLFPDNVEDAFVIFSSLTGNDQKTGEGEEKDYATSVKEFARFLKSDVGGKSASMRLLELGRGVEDIQPVGSSLYQMIEHMLEKGTISAYFLDSGKVRGEIVNPKLNDSPDPENEACANLNETPEQRQQCALERLYRRGKDGSEAPLVQLAELIAELQKDHPELIPSLATWFAGNGPRVVSGVQGYVIRSQVVMNLSKLNVGSYLQAYAVKQGMDVKAPLNADQLADLVRRGFADPDFAAFLDRVVPQINRDAFGERNGRQLNGSSIGKEVAFLYSAPELAAFSRVVIPENTLPLDRAVRIFGNKHRTEALLVNFQGRQLAIEKHLANIWWGVVQTNLGEEVVLEYVIKLAQTLGTQIAGEFRDKNQPIAEWYFSSPYGNPGTTETIVGFAIKEFDILTKYKKQKEWLMNDFVNEAFASEDDKRAARMLIEQVPNIILYIRSGMARSGGDLTRAMNRDKNGFIVRSYVNLIAKVVETGWLKKGVRLIEAYQNRPGKVQRAKAIASVSDEIPDRRKFKKGVEAAERIVRSLIQPQREGDYSTSTLSRLVTPLRSIIGEDSRNLSDRFMLIRSITGNNRRAETERFLFTSADQLLGLTDKQINDFLGDLNKAKPPGTVSERRETFRAAADLLRDPNFPKLVTHLSGLFRDNAVKPALDYLQQKIDDGSLPKVLLMMRRILGFSS